MENTILNIILVILIGSYLSERILAYLNASYFSKPIPKPLEGLYNEVEYQKSQSYKKINYKTSTILSTVMAIVTIVFLVFGGFNVIDEFARSYTDNSTWLGLLFFGIITLGSSLIALPFSYYSTFVIEEKFGFNKSTKKLFFSDFIKGLFLKFLFGGIILYALIALHNSLQNDFWLWAWAVILIFMIALNMFYTKLIVPLFNKQQPLEEGKLNDEIQGYCKKVGFKLNNIFVIDGSKRSSKANAYFSGFGKTKQVTLFDTLIKTLSTEEIVAVLAHEIGHYKHKHILSNLFVSSITIGATLFLLSVCLDYPEISHGMGISTPSFHAGLLGFTVLYSPISAILSFFNHLVSRKFEYQADKYAKDTYESKYLVSSLFKLSKASLSNLTPHPLYVAVYHSHPTLLERTNHLKTSL